MTESGSGGGSISLHDVLYVLFRRKWIALTFAGAVAALVVYAVERPPELYRSDAKLLVTPVASVSIPGAIVDPTVAEIQLIESQGLARAVVDRVGPGMVLQSAAPARTRATVWHAAEAFLEGLGLSAAGPKAAASESDLLTRAAVTRFADALRVGSEPRSSVIDLSYKADEPRAAQTILSETISAYIRKHLEIHSMSASVQLLADQTERLRVRLERAKAAQAEFRDQTQLVQFDEQQNLLLQRIEGLKSQIQSTEAGISSTIASVATTEDKLGMRQAEQEQRAALEALEARMAVLHRQLRDSQAELSSLTSSQGRLETLDQEVRDADAEYGTYRASLEKARIARVLESEQIARIGVLESPTLPTRPEQSGANLLLLGVLAAVFGGIGLAFLLEKLDLTIRTPEDVRDRLKLTCIASIQPVRIRSIRRGIRQEERRRKHIPEPHEPLPLDLAQQAITWMYFVEDVRSSIEDLRAQIHRITEASERRPYVLAITSCHRGEGVSSVAQALAYTAAFTEGQHVMLVNSNNHHPECDAVPALLKPQGLLEVAVERRLIDSLAMGPRSFGNGRTSTGTPIPEPPPASGSSVLASECSSYELVIMDLPSQSEGIHAATQAAAADGSLLVVQSGRLRRAIVETAVERLRTSGANIVGVVLNRRRLYVPKWAYRL